MFRNILLCSDGSDGALKAAQAAGEMAKQFDSAVTILHVLNLPNAFSPALDAVGFTISAEEADRYASQVQDSVARRTGRMLDENGVRYDTRNEVGHPAETISRIANEEGFDLVVLGSRGLSGIQSFLLGSVSDRVAHHARCPVMIVH